MTQLDISTHIRAPRDSVWAAITDHEGMVGWAPLRSVTLAREGSPDRNGVGAVRRMHGPGVTIEEEVVAWDPPYAYDYRLLRGAPIRKHRGRIELSQQGEATEVRWRIEFRPVIPGTGWLLRLVLGQSLGSMLARLKRKLESAAP
jgi:uncharacterized protein YndB with AHSA1/START domain